MAVNRADRVPCSAMDDGWPFACGSQNVHRVSPLPSPLSSSSGFTAAGAPKTGEAYKKVVHICMYIYIYICIYIHAPPSPLAAHPAEPQQMRYWRSWQREGHMQSEWFCIYMYICKYIYMCIPPLPSPLSSRSGFTAAGAPNNGRGVGNRNCFVYIYAYI